MHPRQLIVRAIALLFISAMAGVALADRITLKDGKVIEGLVIKQADQYWVKTPDGESRLIPAAEVVSVVKSSQGRPPVARPAPAPVVPAPLPPAIKAKAVTPATPPAPPVVLGKPTEAVLAVEAKAAALEKPTDLVTLWKEFIDTKPASPADLQYAKDQLAKWTDMALNGGEKIDGKWVVGDEYKKLMEKFKTVFREAVTALQKNETLKAIAKLEEAQKIYARSFHVNFLLGYMAFNQDNIDKSMALFETALKLEPGSAEAATNIGVILFKKTEYEKAIMKVKEAADMADSPDITYNLNAIISHSPRDIQTSEAMKPAVAAAKLLATKYHMPASLWNRGPVVIGLRERSGGHGGGMASGTGFIISSDGLILTNRHVVKGGKSFQVMVQEEKLPAEVVVIDEEQDLAIIRIKPTKPLATVLFSDRDAPVDGAECTVIGFPLIDRIGGSPKVTHGIVTSSLKTAQDGADVLTDAKVNPGNSGGPILDKSGNVMAIVCMKTLATTTEDTYGMGISTGKIRKFLDHNHITVQRAKSGLAGMSVEDIAAKIEPVTVLIMSVH